MKYHLGQSQASCYVCLAKEWQRQYPLTALCRPTSATQHKEVIEEVTRQFTHVRFQLRREEMRQMRDKSIAETMKSSDLCSAGSAQHFEARAKDLDPGWAGSSCRCAISRTALA